MKKSLLLFTIVLQIIAINAIAQQGQALNFNFNANTNVTLNNNIQLADSFTIEAWINPDSKSDFSTIIGNKSPGIASPGYFLAINNYASTDGRIVFETQNATNVSVANVIWNQWQHIAITWNGSLVRMYINGIAQALNDSLYMNLQPSPSPCYLGDIPAYLGNGNYHGNLDELRVWNYARSQQQLQADMYCQLSATQTGLLAYYQFNEGVAYGNNAGINILPDLSGNNNTGTLINFGLSGPSTNWIAPGSVANIISSQNIISCQGTQVMVGNSSYTLDGTSLDTLTATNGCDSIVTSNIVFNPTSSYTQSFTICSGDSVMVGNSTYYNAGNYTDNLLNFNGCDSLVSTNVTVNIPNANVTQVGNSLNAEIGATSYQWIICDSINSIVLNETNLSFSPFIDGNYAVIVTQGNCSAQSACFPIVLTSMNKNEESFFSLYPNPANNLIWLKHLKLGTYCSIANLQGMVVWNGKITNELQKIEISQLKAGMYFISTNSGDHLNFVKE